jgi:exopolyphosphatase/pppGpp-phosphohydrolase
VSLIYLPPKDPSLLEQSKNPFCHLDIGTGGFRIRYAPDSSTRISKKQSRRFDCKCPVTIGEQIKTSFQHAGNLLSRNGGFLCTTGTQFLRTGDKAEIHRNVIDENNIPLTVISGTTEARLIARAALELLALQKEEYINGANLILKIGTGSTEIILTNNSEIITPTSIPIGFEILSNEFKVGKDSAETAILNSTLEVSNHQSIKSLILCGGRMEKLAKLRAKIFNKSNNKIRLSEVKDIKNYLDNNGINEISKKYNISLEDIFNIRAALDIIENTMILLNVDKARFPHCTISNGIQYVFNNFGAEGLSRQLLQN